MSTRDEIRFDVSEGVVTPDLYPQITDPNARLALDLKPLKSEAVLRAGGVAVDMAQLQKDAATKIHELWKTETNTSNAGARTDATPEDAPLAAITNVRAMAIQHAERQRNAHRTGGGK